MTTLEKCSAWLASPYVGDDLKNELRSLDTSDRTAYETELADRFGMDLEFGTAGLRGVLGAGSNRMNLNTVDKATRGFAQVLSETVKNPSVAIGYDSRLMSTEFAKAAAAAFAAKGVRVYLCSELKPTPMLSFAVRYLHCDGGVVITASHNPSKYNGYKAYGPDGGQLTGEACNAVSAAIDREPDFAPLADFEAQLAAGQISYMEKSVQDAYFASVLAVSVKLPAVPVKVAYSPLNGAGNKPVRRILRDIGNVEVLVVPEQENPDGHFPTCPYPNPEIKEAMQLAADLAVKENCDFCLATDPDSDRVGAGVPLPDGSVRLISGNEMGVLLLDFLCRVKTEDGTMPASPLCFKTIVSTPLYAKVAEHYGVEWVNLLTGFKYIGEQLGLLEEKNELSRFVMGYEESYGYLSNPDVRDKDAVNACMLICEMAAFHKSRGMTLLDALEEIHHTHGFFAALQKSIAFEGPTGMAAMNAIMDRLRSNRPSILAGFRVLDITDFLHDETGLPHSNVLRFRLDSGCEVLFRPSGTEPKLKLYITAAAASEEAAGQMAETLVDAATRLIV